MTATLQIKFDDGTTEDIILQKAIELDIGEDRKQSIEFRETKNGQWVMTFTKPIFKGKKFEHISIMKNI
jgi:hypothetical protein